jgi:hypothetical protein
MNIAGLVKKSRQCQPLGRCGNERKSNDCKKTLDSFWHAIGFSFGGLRGKIFPSKKIAFTKGDRLRRR